VSLKEDVLHFQMVHHTPNVKTATYNWFCADGSHI